MIDPAPLGDGVSGVLVINDDHGVIGINQTDALVRQRFTIAHEIGHFELHRGQNRVFIDRQFDKVEAFFRDTRSAEGMERQEVEANAFAACLLMPKRLVQLAIRRKDFRFDLGDEDVALAPLAALFQVSRQAMSFRLSNLGIFAPQ